MDEGNQSSKDPQAAPERPNEPEQKNADGNTPAKKVQKPFVAGPDGHLELPGLPASSLPGIPITRLQDKYEFLTVVGAGGAGVIYKARQQPLGRLVAVKMIHSHRMSATAVKRFHQEAKTISRLSHPNIISVFDFGISEEHQPFMVMDYVEGTPLNELIKEGGSLSLSMTNAIAEQICDGMMHAHAQGILHRDLKPSNVMLVTLEGGQQLVKILDFGLAKILSGDEEAELEHLTQSGETVGTPAYMSPEQVMGKALDQRSDIYSLGCVMYHCLSGIPPFVGKTEMETMLKQLNDMPLSINVPDEEPIVPPDVEALVMTLLSKAADDRVQSMLALKEALVSLDRGLPVNVTSSRGSSDGPLDRGTAASVIGGSAEGNGSASERSRQSSSSSNKDAGLETGSQAGTTRSTTKIATPVIAIIVAVALVGGTYFITTATHNEGGNKGSEKSAQSRGDGTSTTDGSTASTTNGAARTTQPTSNGFDDFGDPKFMADIDGDFNTSELKADADVTDAALVRVPDMPYLATLTLDTSKVSNSGLKTLENGKFSTLSLRHTKIDGDGAPSFTRMPNLKVLDLSETSFDDKGAKAIGSIAALTQLAIDKTRLTDTGAVQLAQLKNLETLSLKDTKIGDTAVGAIAQLPKLSKLNLAGTTVSDSGVKELLKLPHMANLNLDGTKISDKGVAELAKLPLLLELNLSNTEITDACIDSLCKLEGLQRLYLMNCKLTRNAITKFQRRVPSCILVMAPTE